MRILVTGGAGFIGSHLVDRLVSNNHTVSVIDNLSTGTLDNLNSSLKSIEFINGDILNFDLLENLIKNSDIVFHMAAALGVKNIVEKPISSLKANYTGSENVLMLCAKHKKRIFISSTSEIYGKNPIQPLSEDFDRVVGPPQRLRWTYADAKALEESLAYALYQEEKLEVTTLRFFNTVGPRQSAAYGMVLPSFVNAALKNESLKVHGDGSQTRVFCHVQDVIDAIMLMINNVKTIGQVYNVGGVGEISIKDLAELIIKKTASSSELDFVPYEEVYNSNFEDMQRRVPNISKIQNLLNWAPSRDLIQIIDEVILQNK